MEALNLSFVLRFVGTDGRRRLSEEIQEFLMRNLLKRILCLATACAMAGGLALFSACSVSDAASYTVVYDLNYEGAGERAVGVQTGAKAISWKPNRDGYYVEGWYTDKNCTKSFDFSQGIVKNVTLYANWAKSPDVYRVVFDENYAGAETAKGVNVTEGGKVSQNDAPENSRIGFERTGWYTDQACTDEWDFAVDVVTAPTTLYAGYKYDSSVRRNRYGQPIFEGVHINVWRGAGQYTKSILESITAEFNKEYNGKIIVNFTFEGLDNSNQDSFSLRFMQIPEMNRTNDAYYAASDMYDMAGIKYDSSSWYEKATRNSYVEGRLYSVPLFASAPYLVYNKQMMDTYNANAALPASYGDFAALLAKAYEGESKNNPSFRSIVSAQDWSYQEAASYAGFVQNGAEYYEYKNGKYQTGWYGEDILKKAATGLKNTYSLFSANGSLHGAFLDEKSDTYTAAVNEVKNGNAFMGIVNIGYTTVSQVISNDNLGVMPISGLFSDDAEYKNLIPVHTWGFGFYKAAGVNNTELAAAAVYADYVSKNSWRFAESGYWPLRKSVAQSDEFNDNPNANFANIVKIMKQTGDPDNFVTNYGGKNEKKIITKNAFEGLILPFIKENSFDYAEEACVTFRNLMLGLLI